MERGKSRKKIRKWDEKMRPDWKVEKGRKSQERR